MKTKRAILLSLSLFIPLLIGLVLATAVTLQNFSANSITPVAFAGVALLGLLFVSALLLRKRIEKE